jgi:hypothetical protein
MALAHFATLGAHWGPLPMPRLCTSRIVHDQASGAIDRESRQLGAFAPINGRFVIVGGQHAGTFLDDTDLLASVRR